MDAFVAVTSVTQMATQNASHCGFDMFADVLGHGGCSYISVASSKNGSQGASAASSAVQGHDSLAKQGLQMLYISQRYRYNIYMYIYHSKQFIASLHPTATTASNSSLIHGLKLAISTLIETSKHKQRHTATQVARKNSPGLACS